MFLIDCGFDDLMTDDELVSLGSQVTRSYSANRRARFQAYTAICSFGGRLKNRFDTNLGGHHKNWKATKFYDEDFEEASSLSRSFVSKIEIQDRTAPIWRRYDSDNKPAKEGEIIYLTSESPDTLEELKPNSVYIIGGLVDKNRHKGICYKRAMDKGLKTAKLPIKDYLAMASRSVLATNHVVEIMSNWLETLDWGQAFMAAMPKRKGGALKDLGAGVEQPVEEWEDEHLDADKATEQAS